MKTLSEFLARHLIDPQDYFGANAEKDYEEMIKWCREVIAEGIKEYKKHLQNDKPKTVQWAMIEKNLISTLEKMESHNHLNENCCNHEKRLKTKKEIIHEAGCASYNNPPAGFAASVTDCDCIAGVKHPICPLNIYFEGDEKICNAKECDFSLETRSCNYNCKEIKMPYITQKERNIISPFLKKLILYTKDNRSSEGDINYIITSIIHQWIQKEGLRYKNINAAIGVLECAKLELYRMIAASYEDKKKEENGFISELDKITKDEKQAIWKCEKCKTVFIDDEICNLDGCCTDKSNWQQIRQQIA